MSRSSSAITLHPIARRPLDQLDPLLRKQVQLVLKAVGRPRAESYARTELFAVLDSTGGYLYDIVLVDGVEGQAFRGGTTEPIASFSEGEATSGEPGLEAQLDAALARYRRSRKKAKPAAKKKPVKRGARH